VSEFILLIDVIKFKPGRETCEDPDKPNKGGDFPEGDDPNAIEVMMRELKITKREAVALMGKKCSQFADHE